MSLEIPVISDEDPSRSSLEKKARSGEIGVEDPDSDYSDGSEEEIKHCEVCMKDEEHWSYDCPYLDYIPNPEDTPVGEGYTIVCIHCNQNQLKHGHPDGSWVGRATRNPFDSSLIIKKPGVIYHECDDDDEVYLDWESTV
ncbi:hypothetical protein RchiOBHm_Chr2g0170041 [Rosa chinensis]|uniref:Uncharacterized protein n=1 Tax=Rosa chinensis TaxID=74649 RepID=A0A2P6S500_ROSCH|nr:hypothetical protein RchiOBHm_Chr2g0170041 [Rosa chinensis]